MMLRMNEDDGKRCPFVGPDGCTVYDDRPWACRMYPVGMALPPARAGVEPEPVSFLFEDDFCLGREEARLWTVAAWRSDQRVDEQESSRRASGRSSPTPGSSADGSSTRSGWRCSSSPATTSTPSAALVFESSFLDRFAVRAGARGAAEEATTSSFSGSRFRWLRFALFGSRRSRSREREAAMTAQRRSRSSWSGPASPASPPPSRPPRRAARSCWSSGSRRSAAASSGAPLLPEALPALLRHGDQHPPARAEPPRAGPDRLPGDEGRARRRRLARHADPRPGLRQRAVHGLRRLQQGLPGARSPIRSTSG